MTGKDPSFTLVQLRYFAAAADLGSMTAASKVLMVSQSAVSTAVAQLEKELGVQLLIRQHARGLELTPAGRNFRQELRSFLNHSVELADSAARLGNSLIGDLTIGCFSTIAPFGLPTLLAAFEQQFPQVRMGVIESEHADLTRLLREGQCELALMYGFDRESDIHYQPLAMVRPYVIVALDHPIARAGRREATLSEFATDPMVLLDLPHSRDYFLSLHRRAGFTPRIRFRSTGFETVRSLVAHGFGYSILNQRPAHELTYGGRAVATIELTDSAPALELVLANLSGVRLTNRASAFRELCKRHFTATERGTRGAGR
ncbi:MAG TPA: LysR substrate-binding domain-containing protein [Gordonia sp. (in: high G+C Gram-positive bacteria)]|uniref:LysR substrate-binding domain-containing protein n=1 Tax=unclassified Gordonia (in: high G+C Gram-positive bacteria) TaxID=2657482 RepID=UPI000F9D5DFB|nr:MULTISPECIES: LysR substrate-binding domain-containing protein [unclassified Gordonia (in: high G+C Gram-positive bacteria)]RUP40180.1 MAG: LysR family transcriptional regulator [Gordonia sp. (in: high G+C Gram-positive bacteria)]HNP55851.1 LysR substrate-binding domain-containing protein [Gordonia sp. (in: high G+C Gram-positive bacteria)]HRC50926.1 LysR substrate-binding domain-containing protein [Gordonia sp. (in: high G+C Gram-positive bacteria)]